MHNILEEYHHLLEHDNFDCSTHLSGQGFLFRCWFKRYGFSMLCLAGFAVLSYFSVMRALQNELKRKNYY